MKFGIRLGIMVVVLDALVACGGGASSDGVSKQDTTLTEPAVKKAAIAEVQDDRSSAIVAIPHGMATKDATPLISGTFSPSLSKSYRVMVFTGETAVSGDAVYTYENNDTSKNMVGWRFTPNKDLSQGRHSFRAAVMDAMGTLGPKSDTARDTIILTANPSFSTSSPNVLDTVTFSVNNLYSGITSVSWDLGDGSTVQTSTVTNATASTTTRYLAKGDKTVTASYKNASGAVLATDSLTVSIAEGSVSQTASISSASANGTTVGSGGRTDSLALTLNGTYSGNALGSDYRIRVLDGGTTLGDAALAADAATKTWSFTTGTLAAGSHDFKAVVVRNIDSKLGDTSSPFVLKLGNTLWVGNSSPTVLEKINFEVKNLWSQVVTVVWNFGVQASDLLDQIVEKTAALVQGVMANVNTAFTSARDYVVTAIFQGPDGQEIDRTSVTLTVSSGAVTQRATIESVWDEGRSVEAGGEVLTSQPLFKGKLSAALDDPDLYYVVLRDGDNLLPGKASVNGLDWIYSPPSGLSDGVHNLSAVVSRFDGLLGAPSDVRTVVVSAMAPAIAPLNRFMPDKEFNPAPVAGSFPPSDTTGNFPATVLFAQSHIFPATSRIPNDFQPVMTSLRDALVMFRPHRPAELAAGKGVLLKAYKADGSFLERLIMEHPNDIPKTQSFLNGIDISAINFDFNPSGALEISSAADLANLNDSTASYLKTKLANSNSIKIVLADGKWNRDIYLPSGSYTGKKILITSNAQLTSTVRYIGEDSKGNAKQITTGGAEVFTAIAGNRWVNKTDLGHSSYVYGKNFWTAKLPKEWIQPGLKLEFIQGDKKGSLNFASQGLTGVKISAPTELLIHVIDLGMLTAPQNKLAFSKDDSLHSDYFQIAPVSRLVVSKYESLQLDSITMPDGRRFTPEEPDPSPDVGVYSGDMRKYISKLLILHGINNANYGITSSSSTEERWDRAGHPYWAAQISANNAVGKYLLVTQKQDFGKDGLWVHGLSGGAGMLSLKNTTGNEFSHEIGHNFGLLHFGGSRQSKASIFRPSNDVNSAWFWDSRSNIFIPNFVQNPTTRTSSTAFERTCYWAGWDEVLSDCVAPFQINDSLAYSYGRDTMSAAGPNEPPHWPQVNRYSMYSPDSAFRTQEFLESKVVFDKTSSTGFRKWNPNSYKMEEIELRVPYYRSIIADVSSSKIANVASYTSYLQSLFNDGADLVTVQMGNAYFGATAVAPAASANLGKWLTIKHLAISKTTWTINGQAVVFLSGDTQTYQSNGTQWIPQVNFSDTVPRKPALFGVPVTTIVGYYDPQITQPTAAQPGWPGYIYPALHGAYGFVYPSESDTRPATGCWLEVNTSNPMAVRRYKLHAERLTDDFMNKLQVNIPQSERATSAAVFCNNVTLTESSLLPARNPADLTFTVNGMPLSRD